MLWSRRANVEKAVDVRFRFGAGRRLNTAVGAPPGVLSDWSAQGVELGAVALSSFPPSAVAFTDLSRNGGQGERHISVS